MVSSGAGTQQHRSHRWTLAFTLASLLALVFLLQTEGLATRLIVVQDVISKTVSLKGVGKSDTGVAKTQADRNNCRGQCSARVQERTKRWGGDLLNMADVKRLATQARDKLVARLKVDYGEDNFANIFEVNGVSRGRRFFLSANVTEGLSTKRFKRKLKMKILSVQKAIQEQEDAVGCNCRGGTEQSSRRDIGKEASSDNILIRDSLPEHFARMVWATGGHSVAAGHGNLFNESYTAFLEQAASVVFGAIGIDFEGRNCAMGGTSSSPEIALCSEAVFGTDPDVISWDYAMVDGRIWQKKGMYANRAGLNPNRPAIVDMFLETRFLGPRRAELQWVEERGLTALYMSSDEAMSMIDAIPDTFGKTADEINAMPRMVKHLKCQGTIEKGDPTCRTNKYDDALICPSRKYMAAWHPGWKMMALWGNAMALYLADALLDAIEELQSPSNPVELLNQLLGEEDADYEKFVHSMLPTESTSGAILNWVNEDFAKEVNISHFYRSPSICRTARLPSQSRYLGIVTESNETGIHDYYKGLSSTEVNKRVMSESIGNATMPLVYNPAERQKCEVELNRDYKDFFYTTSKQGWTSLAIPNEAEKRAYARESEKQLGAIVICLAGCPWGKCPAGDMQKQSIQEGLVKFEVNDQAVTNFTEFLDCGVLQGEHGFYWKANDAGQYVLKAHVLDDGSPLSFLRISSVIVL